MNKESRQRAYRGRGVPASDYPVTVWAVVVYTFPELRPLLKTYATKREGREANPFAPNDVKRVLVTEIKPRAKRNRITAEQARGKR